MDHYIELRVLPDPEFSTPMLLEALFAKLHRALGGRIGVSFPDAGKTLWGNGYGCTVRRRH